MSDQKLSGRRERRIAARRAQILEAAARLFAEQGFHRTTTKDIAEAADVAEGTLYNYFEDKGQLLLGIMEYLVQTHEVKPKDDAILIEAQEYLVGMLRQRREFVNDHGAMLQAVLSEILVDPDLRRLYYENLIAPNLLDLEQHLRSRGQLGQFRPLDPALLARFLAGLTNGLFLLEVLGDPYVKSEWDALQEMIASIVFEGVALREER